MRLIFIFPQGKTYSSIDPPLIISQSVTAGQTTTTKSTRYPPRSPLFRDKILRPLVSSNLDGCSSTTPRNSIRFHSAFREGRKVSLNLLLLQPKTKEDEVYKQRRNPDCLQLSSLLSLGSIAVSAFSSTTSS